MTDTKQIDGWLIVDWKKESLRARKTEPTAGEMGTNELKAELSAEVGMPDVDVPELSVELEVPESQIYAATIKALHDEDLPDWSGVANEKIDANRVAFEQSDNSPEWKSAVDETVVDTLRECPGRPDVVEVRNYVDRMAKDMFESE